MHWPSWTNVRQRVSLNISPFRIELNRIHLSPEIRALCDIIGTLPRAATFASSVEFFTHLHQWQGQIAALLADLKHVTAVRQCAVRYRGIAYCGSILS